MSKRIANLGKVDADNFNAQVNKAINNKALVAIDEELYAGLPARYSPTVFSFSGKIQSTPVRFCTDASRDDFMDATAFNLLTLKGAPGNNLSMIMLNLRTHTHCALTDLSSAYHQILLGALEASLRRV